MNFGLETWACWLSEIVSLSFMRSRSATAFCLSLKPFCSSASFSIKAADISFNCTHLSIENVVKLLLTYKL